MFSVVECCKGVFTMKMAPIYLFFVIKMKVTAGLFQQFLFLNVALRIYLTCEGNSKLHMSPKNVVCWLYQSLQQSCHNYIMS